MKAVASLQTQCAGRYLKALCHHFGRRVDVSCDGTAGWVLFPFGRCDMSADDTTLELSATAEDRRHLAQVTGIVTSHLERFAFRENPRLDWRDAAEGSVQP